MSRIGAPGDNRCCRGSRAGPLFAFDDEQIAREIDLDVLLADARQLGRDNEFVVGLHEVDGGHHARSASERSPAGTFEEVLEYKIDLAPEAEEWVEQLFPRRWRLDAMIAPRDKRLEVHHV
jgi:hypothetical protein